MKKVLTVLISICCAAGAYLGLGEKAALAETRSEPFYPESFSSFALVDYAVNGDTYAFTADKKIAVVTGQDKPVYYELGFDVAALDCADGVFYYQDGENTVYSLPDKAVAENYTITQTNETRVFDDTYVYQLLGDKSISIWDGTNTEVLKDGEYSKLKKYGGTVYAIKDGKLNKIVPPAAAEPVPFEFTDFSAAENIPVGNTADVLKTFNADNLHFVTLNANAYATRIDNMDKLGAAETFLAGKTYLIGEEVLKADQSALLLGTVGANGSVSIVMTGGKCYLMRTDNTSPVTNRGETLTKLDFNTGIVNAAEYAYSAPFDCKATRKFEIKPEDVLTVLGEVSVAVCPELETNYYKVRNADGETGYVMSSFVIRFYGNGDSSSGNETPSVTRDPEYSEEDAVKTVVIIIVVVALVLAAVGYLVFITVGGKKNADKNNNEKE